MAVGGALRAALKAADWTKAARESRRRARALAELNARGGVGRPGRAQTADEYLFSREVPFERQSFMNTGQMYDGDYNPAFESGRLLGYDLPQRGRFAFRDPVTGATSTDVNRMAFGYAPGTRPIEAPYEGFGVVPTRSMAARDLDRLTEAGLPEDLSLYGDYFAAKPVSGFPTDFAVPRAFGGDSRGYSPFVTQFPNRPRYFFNDVPF